MPMVLDASIAAAWAFDDESSPVAAKALMLASSETFLVPPIWWFEIANTLAMNERRQRIAAPVSDRFLLELNRFAIVTDQDAGKSNILALARRHRLTVYDAAYLELAWRRAARLATLDAALRRAATAEGVALLDA